MAIISLLGGGFVVWADVQSDLAVGIEKDKQHDDNYDRIDRKLDKIIDHLIKREEKTLVNTLKD